jgi:hypothetical protein
MKRRSTLLALLFVPAISHAREPRFHVVPLLFDPAHTGAVISRWVAFARDEAALIMSKILPTDDDAAAVATIEGAQGVTLGELGFDVFLGGHCGAGAPRFNVTTTGGHVYFFGCADGTHASASPTFARVRFGDADAEPQLPSDPPWPGFGYARIEKLEIVFDDGIDVGSGFTAIGNIDIDGEFAGE